MLTHDHNTVETEVKETEEKNPILETVLNESEDKMSIPTVEDEKEEPSIAIPEETISEEPETDASEQVQSEEIAETLKLDTKRKELTQEEKEHQEMLSMYEESFSSFKKGEIIEGTVVDISDKEVRVDIGFKSEGVIPISEFAYSGIPDTNSVIKVYISEIENGEGKVLLSKKKADYLINIESIKRAFTEKTSLTGIIRRRVKGGMIVDVHGIEGFLPGSQMSLKPIPNLDQFIGKELVFKVVNIDEDHHNIILSRRQVLEEEAEIKRQELLKKIEIDSELDGEVKNITQYGAFIDLGGIDGLLHLTDMSWGKINHPSEMLQIGDKVKVKVINFDAETNRISLGLKQLVPHPWENIEIKYPEGSRVTGKVVNVKSFGAFVELEPGVEGLVHISEMSWTKKITDARKFVKVGDTINAIVLDLDKENKRISLGMKQMDPNPWLTIEDRYPIGTVLNRKIKSLTAFGAFVEIEEGIDGLIHISDMSWTKRIYHPREVYKRNQEVEAVVLSIDRAQHRIALGVKQMVPDPWETLDQILPVNTEVKGKVSKLIPKGLLVDIPIGNDVVEGFIPISHLAIPKLEHSEDAFYVGEELPLKVIELDMENRRLILSVKAFFFSRDPKLQDEYIVLHEQYMRDKVARQLKKKQEKEMREKKLAAKKDQEEAEKAEETVEKSPEPVAEEVSVAIEPETEKTEIQQEPTTEEAPIETEIQQEPTTEEAPIETEKAEEIPVEIEKAEEAIEAVQKEEVIFEPEEKNVSEEQINEETITEETAIDSSVSEEQKVPEKADDPSSKPEETSVPEEESDKEK
ncbi:MAG: 30S ribosomal protein S1 [Candidatus Cloacimonetes bacterium]|jgi:small subunit ribosomal protein S1|nr:30S ribosomal protein S1 [Candidatus Cloacimonadota bacterium]MDD3868918.1 30S ribosomal protein S1 [Candidatus Cloacimonadota bacterium]MDD4676359.1 30S ribosomal protein S1 [Candidatus Cloacimonadota bacterium]